MYALSYTRAQAVKCYDVSVKIVKVALSVDTILVSWKPIGSGRDESLNYK